MSGRGSLGFSAELDTLGLAQAKGCFLEGLPLAVDVLGLSVPWAFFLGKGSDDVAADECMPRRAAFGSWGNLTVCGPWLVWLLLTLPWNLGWFVVGF